MDQLGLALIILFSGLGLVVFVRQIRRENRARKSARSSFFEACKSLLSDCRSGTTATGFQRVSGGFRGAVFDFQAVPDSLTFRKLPALWVKVSLPGVLPLDATMDMIVRPGGGESFSGFHAYRHQISLPAGYPQDCAIRTDDPTKLLPDTILLPHLSLFDNERVKELVVSPKGLQITFLAEEANRGRYLIFRDLEMGRSPLHPDRIRPFLEAMLALRSDLLTLRTPTRESLIA